jgi:hypothetical protein
MRLLAKEEGRANFDELFESFDPSAPSCTWGEKSEP